MVGYLKFGRMFVLQLPSLILRALMQGGLYVLYILTRLTVNPLLRMRRGTRYRLRANDIGIATIGNIYALRQVQSKGKTGSR